MQALDWLPSSHAQPKVAFDLVSSNDATVSLDVQKTMPCHLPKSPNVAEKRDKSHFDACRGSGTWLQPGLCMRPTSAPKIRFRLQAPPRCSGRQPRDDRTTAEEEPSTLGAAAWRSQVRISNRTKRTASPRSRAAKRSVLLTAPYRSHGRSLARAPRRGARTRRFHRTVKMSIAAPNLGRAKRDMTTTE